MEETQLEFCQRIKNLRGPVVSTKQTNKTAGICCCVDTVLYRHISEAIKAAHYGLSLHHFQFKCRPAYDPKTKMISESPGSGQTTTHPSGLYHSYTFKPVSFPD